MSTYKRKPLGPLITTHRDQPLTWRDFALVFIPLVVAVLAPLGYGLWRTFYGYTNFGPAAARTWGRTWFLVSAGLLLLVLVYTLIRFSRSRTWIEVHKDGLLIHTPPSRKRYLTWNQIWGITSFATRKNFPPWKSNPKPHLVLFPVELKPVKLNSRLENLNGLSKTIKKEVYRRIQPKFSRALQSGKRLPFGVITITKEHLLYQDQEIPWRYIEQISVGDGKLSLDLSWEITLEIPVHNIQNIELLIHFIESEI